MTKFKINLFLDRYGTETILSQFTTNYSTFSPLAPKSIGLGSGKILFRIPDPGVKKAMDPGYESAILEKCIGSFGTCCFVNAFHCAYNDNKKYGIPSCNGLDYNRHRYVADPNPDPTPTITHMLKNHPKKLDLFSKQCQSTLFYHSHTRMHHRCHNFQYFVSILKFSVTNYSG
jgi:hypothetical protein